MIGKARNVAVATVLLALLAPVPSPAQTTPPSLKDQLVGNWQLVSVTINDMEPYGANPQGAMMLDATGHYAIIVLSSGNATNIAYYGTYTLDDAAKTMTLHIDGSTRPRADGRDQKRLITLSGDQLVQETQEGGKAAIKLTWKRAN
jgi:hypothetical protein